MKKKIEIVRMFTCLERCVPVVIAMQIDSEKSVPAAVYILKKWADNST